MIHILFVVFFLNFFKDGFDNENFRTFEIYTRLILLYAV